MNEAHCTTVIMLPDNTNTTKSIHKIIGKLVLPLVVQPDPIKL